MSDFHRHTIGLLFDNSADRRLLCEHLTEEGYTVCAPAPQAAALATWDDVSLIISDLACARRQLEAIVAVKERSDNAFLPLLIALDKRVDELRWLSAGFDDVLRLPITKAELKGRLRTVLRLREQSRDLAQRSEKMYRALVEQSLAGVALIVDRQFEYVNDAGRRIFGYDSIDELMRVPPLDLVHPDDRDRVYENMRQRLSGAVDTSEYRFRGIRKDGSVVYLQIFGRRIDYDGTPATLGTIVDVTEQVRAQERQRFQADILRNVRDSVIVTGLDGRIIYWNEGAESIFGYTADEMIGETAAVTYPTIDPAAFRSHLEQIVEQGEFRAEWKGRRKDGSTVWIDIRTTPMYDSDGDLVGFIGVGKDITERKKMEQELRRSEQRFRTTFEGAGIGMAIVDKHGHPIETNPALQEMLGYDEDELRQMVFADYTHPGDAAVDMTYYQELVAGKRTQYRMEKRFLYKDGDVIWGRLNVSRLPRNDDTPAFAVAMVEDITERKRIEEKFKQQNRELKTLLHVGQQMAGQLDLDRVLSFIVGAMLQTVSNAEAASLWLYDETRRCLAVRSWVGYDADEMREFALPPDTGLVGHIFQHGRPRIVDDTVDDPFFTTLNYAKVDSIRSVLGVPIRSAGTIIGVLFADCFTDTGAFGESDLQVLQALAGHAGVALANARLFEAERAARQHAETLRIANVALTQTLDLDAVLETLLDCLHDLIPYDSGCVMLWKEDRAELIIAAIRGYDDLDAPEETLLGHTYDPELYQNLRLPLTTHESLIIDIDDVGAYVEWDATAPGAAPIGSWIGVPLIAGGEVYGLFSLDKHTPAFFTEKHQQLAETVAGQAAVAIQNAQLFEQVHAGRKRLQDLSQRLVEIQEEERQRIAIELHDEVGQILTGLKLTLEMAARTLPAETQQKLESANSLTEELIGKVRRLSLDLRPTILDDLGLLPTLLWYFDRYTTQTGIDVEFQHSGIDWRFETTVETTAYRVTQEALTNVARHTDVENVDVRVWTTEKRLCVKVEDAGPGFDVEAVLTEGTTGGVAGMHERVNLVGGRLTIESSPGAGTTLLAELSLDDGMIERRIQGRT